MSEEAERARLAERIHRTVVHLMRRLRREDEGLDHPAAHLTTLTTLVSQGAMTLGELADAEGVRPATMSRRIQQLEAARLVIRSPSPDDGRVVRIRHSGRALGVLEAGREARVRSLGARLTQLTSDDRAVLERALEILDDLAHPPSCDR